MVKIAAPNDAAGFTFSKERIRSIERHVFAEVVLTADAVTKNVSPCIWLDETEFVGPDSDNRTINFMLFVDPCYAFTSVAFVEDEERCYSS